ncbi:MAG: anti-sigma factor [Flavobacteriaceae bacterium]
MDVEKYISSGVLELYVAGLLSEKENLEVHRYAMEHPEIKSEIEAIEAAVMAVARTASPDRKITFDGIADRMQGPRETKVVPISEKSGKWTTYLGWAASVFLSIGLFWMYTENQKLRSENELAEKNNDMLEQQIADANLSLENTQNLLALLRDKNVKVVPLGGQEVSPTSYAKAYWNEQDQKLFIDAIGLPEPPDGMVYQVWSLKLNPLTPTSVGLLEDFAMDNNKVFALSNPNDSEAFGITLEPAGGSTSPNLEQLYALGAVTS